jgi:hypothetical protein
MVLKAIWASLSTKPWRDLVETYLDASLNSTFCEIDQSPVTIRLRYPLRKVPGSRWTGRSVGGISVRLRLWRNQSLEISIFCDIFVTMCNSFKVSRPFPRNVSLLPTRLTLFSCLALYSTLKMEEKYSSETSVDLQRPTLRYNPTAVRISLAIQ